MSAKPRRVIVKITRTVTEIAKCLLDKDGNVEEVEETHEEIDYEVTDIHRVLAVLSWHSQKRGET